MKKQAAQQPAPQAPEEAAQADAADQFEKETEQLTKDQEAASLPQKAVTSPAPTKQPVKTAAKALPFTTGTPEPKKAASIGTSKGMDARKAAPAKPLQQALAKSSPAAAAKAPSVEELTKKAVQNALNAAKQQSATPQPAPQPQVQPAPAPVLVPPAPESSPTPDAEQQETITNNIAAFRKTLDAQPTTQMNQMTAPTPIPSIPTSSVATDANGNIVVDANGGSSVAPATQ